MEPKRYFTHRKTKGKEMLQLLSLFISVCSILRGIAFNSERLHVLTDIERDQAPALCVEVKKLPKKLL